MFISIGPWPNKFKFLLYQQMVHDEHPPLPPPLPDLSNFVPDHNFDDISFDVINIIPAPKPEHESYSPTNQYDVDDDEIIIVDEVNNNIETSPILPNLQRHTLSQHCPVLKDLDFFHTPSPTTKNVVPVSHSTNY